MDHGVGRDEAQRQSALRQDRDVGRPEARMDSREDPRESAALGEGVQESRPREDHSVVRAEHGDRGAQREEHASRRAHEDAPRVGERRLRQAEIGHGADGDELDERIEGRHRDELDHQRERKIALRVLELAGRGGDGLEAGIGVEDEEGRLSEVAGVRSGHREDAVPRDFQKAGRDQREERQELSDREDDGGARSGFDPDDVDPGEEPELEQDRQSEPRSAARGRPEIRQNTAEEDGQARDGGDAGEPRHPANLEAREVSERGAGVEIGAAGLVETAPRFREAQDDEENDQSAGRDGPYARRPQQLRGRHGQDEIHAASDHAVDRERDDLPAGHGSQKARRRRGGGRAQAAEILEGETDGLPGEIPAARARPDRPLPTGQTSKQSALSGWQAANSRVTAPAAVRIPTLPSSASEGRLYPG